MIRSKRNNIEKDNKDRQNKLSVQNEELEKTFVLLLMYSRDLEHEYGTVVLFRYTALNNGRALCVYVILVH